MSRTKILISYLSTDSFSNDILHMWDVLGEPTDIITSVYAAHTNPIRVYNLVDILPIYDNLRVYQLKMLSDGYWIYGKCTFGSLYDVIRELK